MHRVAPGFLADLCRFPPRLLSRVGNRPFREPIKSPELFKTTLRRGNCGRALIAISLHDALRCAVSLVQVIARW